MIKTVVFDLGGVLVEFNPEKGMRELGFSEEAIQVFKKNIFSGLWESCDRTPLEDQEIRQLFKDHVPGYEKEVDLLWDRLPVVTGVMPYAKEWLLSLKEAGLKLYVLSNYGKRSFEINSQIYDFLDMFDGQVISYQLEIVKPEAGIYDHLADKYGFDPEEAIFIDDRQINVDGAIARGYQGLLFTNYDNTRDALERLLKVK